MSGFSVWFFDSADRQDKVIKGIDSDEATARKSMASLAERWGTGNVWMFHPDGTKEMADGTRLSRDQQREDRRRTATSEEASCNNCSGLFPRTTLVTFGIGRQALRLCRNCAGRIAATITSQLND